MLSINSSTSRLRATSCGVLRLICLQLYPEPMLESYSSEDQVCALHDETSKCAISKTKSFRCLSKSHNKRRHRWDFTVLSIHSYRYVRVGLEGDINKAKDCRHTFMHLISNQSVHPLPALIHTVIAKVLRKLDTKQLQRSQQAKRQQHHQSQTIDTQSYTRHRRYHHDERKIPNSRHGTAPL